MSKKEHEIMHWADQAAEQIINKNPNKKEYIAATGATPSGMIHVGNFREFIMGHFIAKAINDKGKKGIHLHYWDNYDVFRKVPVNMPKQDILKTNLKKPLTSIPDVIDNKHKSYAEHHQAEFEKYLKIVGVTPLIVSNTTQYKECILAEEMKTALENTDKIKEILNRFRKEDLVDSWLPISVYDEETNLEVEEVEYLGDYNLKYKDTKGKDQTFDFRKKGLAKFKYRIQVPAYWNYKKIDFESAGKDHFAAGGVFQTAGMIAKEVYNIERALGFGFGWIGIKGGKQFSSSTGVIFTLKDVLEVYEPNMVRWFFAGSRPGSEFNISFDLDVVKYYEDFDKVERIYFNQEKVDEKEKIKQSRIYELSAIEIPKKLPFQPSFRHLTNIYQLHQGDIKKIEEYYKEDLKTKEDENKLKLRIECVKNWLEQYAPDAMKFQLQENLNKDIKLSKEQKDSLKILRERLETKKYTEESLYEDFMNICNEADIKPQEFFKAAYQVLLNKERGPKLAGFIILIGVKKMISLLKEI